MSIEDRNPAPRGRPSLTSHAAIERAAFELFAAQGFADTTIDDIARAVGVGRRTISRYYASKNDIPWGQFADTLDAFAGILNATPLDVPVYVAVRQGMLAFNDFPSDAQPSHRDRMRLILTTPELQAHSVHQYAEWRQVIARFVASREECDVKDPLPQLVGHVSLALALATYEQWLRESDEDLLVLLRRSFDDLRDFVIQ